MILELTLSATLWAQHVLPAITAAGCLTHPPSVAIARQQADSITVQLTVVESQRLCCEAVLSGLGVQP